MWKKQESQQNTYLCQIGCGSFRIVITIPFLFDSPHPSCLEGRWIVGHFCNYSLRPRRFGCHSCSALVSPIAGEIIGKSLMSGFLTLNVGTNGRLDCQWRKNPKHFYEVREIQMGWTTDCSLGAKIPVFFTLDKCLKVDVTLDIWWIFGLWRLLLGSYT